MTEEQMKKRILTEHWEPWLKRPFFGFILSTFYGGNTKKAFKKIGLPGWECNFLFSDGQWYSSDSSYASATRVVRTWLKNHSVIEISQRLETSQKKWIVEMKRLASHPKIDHSNKLQRLAVIFREITTYIWAVHAAEHFFTPILQARVAKVIKGDINTFISDASFPSKPNAVEQMVEEYKNGTDAKELVNKYGWMRARDGFARPYTAKELIESAKYSFTQLKLKHPKVPRALDKIFAEARELVYLRMLRSDIYFEIIFLARPILKVAARKYNIPYSALKFYTLQSLIDGKPKFYPKNFSYAAIKGRSYYVDKPLFTRVLSHGITELRGNVAQTGLVKGRVKIVMSVRDIPKVQKGDILVTYMTSPNFLPAMKLASGFVTDEGGLTCHAAIVAREMGKPCIIGTKIATKIFKDNDVVEVNANTGIIKKL